MSYDNKQIKIISDNMLSTIRCGVAINRHMNMYMYIVETHNRLIASKSPRSTLFVQSNYPKLKKFVENNDPTIVIGFNYINYIGTVAHKAKGYMTIVDLEKKKDSGETRASIHSFFVPLPSIHSALVLPGKSNKNIAINKKPYFATNKLPVRMNYASYVI